MHVSGSHGAVRLIGGLIPEEGTVEVCRNGMWSSVCQSSWDYKDAFVVCRQFGYPATGEDDGGPCIVRGEVSVSVCWRVVVVSGPCLCLGQLLQCTSL